MKHVKQYQAFIRGLIKADLENNLNFNSMRDPSEYALISGKRLRPMILLSIADDGRSNNMALFIEYIHCASLVIDDLPCMDNDLERRGQPTLHIKFGQHIAQLVAFNLTITAMKHVSDGLIGLEQIKSPKDFKILQEIINNEINTNLSSTGICGGQLLDLSLDDIDELSDRLQKERILKLIELKTGCLFSLAFLLGWVYNPGATVDNCKDIKRAGMSFGICYQIIDDLKDIVVDREKNQAKNNICRYYTHNELIDVFSVYIGIFNEVAIKYNIYNSLLQELNKYLLESFKKSINSI